MTEPKLSGSAPEHASRKKQELKMSFVKSILAAVALMLSAASVTAPVASAQTKVVVINTAKIMRDSKAGKDIRSKVEAIGRTMDAEIKPKRDRYVADDAAFAKNFEGMTEQQANAKVQGDQALQQKYVQLIQLQQELQLAAATAQRDLRYTQGQAWNTFNTSLSTVLEEGFNEQSAEIMVDRSNLIYSAPSVDVTATVISKLDARTPSISVVRQSPPQQAAQ